MGGFHKAAAMFQGVNYSKIRTQDLKPAMERKVLSVTAKIEERRGRIARIMKEYSITDAALGDMIIQYMKDRDRGNGNMTYSNSIKTHGNDGPVTEMLVPAGVIANLVTEKELIESEKAEIDRMQLIIRNLKETEDAHSPTTGEVITRPTVHKLSDEDLIYLGF